MDKFILAILTLIVVIAMGVQIHRYMYGEEGFIGSDLQPGSYISQFFPARGDVGEHDEEAGFRRDNRYFSGYTDVQRLGIDHDFCRMIEPEGQTTDPKSSFFACALAATEQLSGTSYRTETVGEGFKRGRDDYMRDTSGSGRSDYCRILRAADDSFQPLCRRAMDRRFGKKDIVDPKPPADIVRLLNFYDGIMMWLRMRDDLVDYAQNLLVSKGGGIKIDETPFKTPGYQADPGLTFNGVGDFLRLGENRSLEFGDQNINMRSARAISFWVYFEEFTNNAHIFDFGNGAGRDNVFCGIVGRGNPTISKAAIRDLLCDDKDTLPLGPSGQQPVFSDGFAAIPSGCMETAEGGSTAKGFTDGAAVMTPQKLMKTSAANVNEYDSKGFEVVGRRMPALQPRALKADGRPVSADIIYEVWDAGQRAMQIKVADAVKLREWTHITITAESNDAFRPDIAVYVNGRKAATKPSGFLPQTNYMTHNYIGKSNWSSASSQYENRDEMFKGRLFDFRVYNNQMGFSKIMETIKWGAEILEIPVPGSPEPGRSSKYMQDVVPVGSLTSFADIDKERYAIGDTTSAITVLQ